MATLTLEAYLEGPPSMRRLLAAFALMSLIAACGTGTKDDPKDPSPEPTTTTAAPDPTPSPTEEATAEPVALDSFTIAPGAVGDVAVGMTIDEAVATGFFDTDVKRAECADETSALAWKEAYASAFDVWTDADSRLVAMGVFAPGPQTADGLGVSSTLADITAVYETAEMAEAGYNQTGVFVSDGEAWIGFLIDSPLDDVERDDQVTLMEVTRGAKPSLVRDGC